LSQDELLGLFAASETGAGVTLEPATIADMCGKDAVEKTSLEVVYEEI
jgi:chlorophyllide a reductase subunit X